MAEFIEKKIMPRHGDEKFAELIANGYTNVEAYLLAYRKNVKINACKKKSNPVVISYTIEALKNVHPLTAQQLNTIKSYNALKDLYPNGFLHFYNNIVTNSTKISKDDFLYLCSLTIEIMEAFGTRNERILKIKKLANKVSDGS